MKDILNRLELVEARYNELGELLLTDAVLKDNRQMAKLGKEQSSLQELVMKYERLKEIFLQTEEANLLLEENDPEIKEMASLELQELAEEQDNLLQEIEVLLIPRDPSDDHNAIMEIRGAAGGDEGNIFAGDLMRMYTRYIETKGFKYEVMESSESEAGGFSLVSLFIKGKDAYRFFKFESGAHRVQRVPKTETQGRVHTSTATVLVLPEAEETDIEIDPNDLQMDTHRSSGAGGQHVNKTDSAVRITHIPTGITVNCQDGRSQHDNRATAMRIIRARVMEEYQRIENEKKGSERKAKIGTGDRSEKIRTYNYPQNRVTDHRIGLTINQLDRIVEGKLDDIVEALLAEEQRQKLLGEK